MFDFKFKVYGYSYVKMNKKKLRGECVLKEVVFGRQKYLLHFKLRKNEVNFNLKKNLAIYVNAAHSFTIKNSSKYK